MGNLARYLQLEFSRHKPPGWSCTSEVAVTPPELCKLLGFTPKTDVLLANADGSRRYWIEFEVSRADPVANHAKFAATHLFSPQSDTDVFVSMVSPHVATGRRNLGATAISLMRHVGMNAFQTTLLPRYSPQEVKHLNQMPLHELRGRHIDISSEILRVFDISKPLISFERSRIHFVANLLEVILNIRSWNTEIQNNSNKLLWGKRIVKYFVFDNRLKWFAPSKYCAFTFINPDANLMSSRLKISDLNGMSIKRYSSIERNNWQFDGQRAKNHLIHNLGMVLIEAEEDSKIWERFQRWLGDNSDSITVHPSRPKFILFP